MVRSEGRARGEGSAAGPSVGECAAFREEREEGVNRMPRNIGDSVVVVTGASSSIGRATARLFAENGARVVLAARSEGSLREAADECEAAHVLLPWPQTSSPRTPTQFGPFSPRQGPLCAR